MYGKQEHGEAVAIIHEDTYILQSEIVGNYLIKFAKLSAAVAHQPCDHFPDLTWPFRSLPIGNSNNFLHEG